MAKKMKSLEDLYTDLLKDLYSAEKQLTVALPKMAKAAQAPDLKNAFEEHHMQTERQAQMIEEIFSNDFQSRSPRGKKCVGMEGLIEESKELLSEEHDGMVVDAGLIAAAQKVEHYEIAGYGTARTWARILGHNEASDKLQRILEEESTANEKLNRIAESHVNRQAKR